MIRDRIRTVLASLRQPRTMIALHQVFGIEFDRALLRGLTTPVEATGAHGTHRDRHRQL